MVNQFGQHIPDYPGQQPHQDQAYMRYWAQQNQRYQQPQAQSQQPTSRMAEVFLAANEKAVYDFPVAAGTTVLFVAGDESFIAIKEVSVAGQISTTFYDKRPPAPQEMPIDPTMYVTRKELEQRLAGLEKRTEGDT